MPEIRFDCVVSAVADLYSENEQKLFVALFHKIKHS